MFRIDYTSIIKDGQEFMKNNSITVSFLCSNQKRFPWRTYINKYDWVETMVDIMSSNRKPNEMNADNLDEWDKYTRYRDQLRVYLLNNDLSKKELQPILFHAAQIHQEKFEKLNDV